MRFSALWRCDHRTIHSCHNQAPVGQPVLIPDEATKADVEAHFASHGTGEITEIKLMNGFGFIEYKDAMDARDVVPGESQYVPAVQTSSA